MKSIEVIKGDITEMNCEAIVNAANSSLLGGGGVDGAIHEKAGFELFSACMEIGGCPTGEARLTPGFNLQAKFVIHAVGPVWENGQNGEKELLKKAYSNSLKLASENGIKSIAFPNIGTGIFNYPKVEAAEIAISTVKNEIEKNNISKVVFVCFDEDNYEIYKKMIP